MVGMGDLRDIEIPEDFANERGDLDDRYRDWAMARTGPTRSGKPSVGMYYGDDPLLGAKVYRESKELWSSMSKEERAKTSLGEIAMNRMLELQQTAGPPAVSFSPQKKSPITKKQSATVMEPKDESKPSKLTRRRSTNTNPFSQLKILGLKPEPFEPEMALMLRYLENNEPIEQAYMVHWAEVKENDYGSIIEVDVIVDGRHPSADTIETGTVNGNGTMSVSIYCDDEEIEFEAIRGMFETQFGVFRLYKILAAF